jgi:hypothetical protein
MRFQEIGFPEGKTDTVFMTISGLIPLRVDKQWTVTSDALIRTDYRFQKLWIVGPNYNRTSHSLMGYWPEMVTISH